MPHYTQLTITDVNQLTYGYAPYPVTTKSGLIIGGGTVYPELNFTLPTMDITSDTLPEVRTQYSMMIEDVCARAVALHAPGLVVEYELLPPQTMNPEWGAEITALLRATLDKYSESAGLKSALRVTPNDIREHKRPPIMRAGHLWDNTMVKTVDRDKVHLEEYGISC